eukprot:COSAG05_NODE_2357_length_3186_cov_2.218983_2_plen_58_part_00
MGIAATKQKSEPILLIDSTSGNFWNGIAAVGALSPQNTQAALVQGPKLQDIPPARMQ